VAAPDGGLRGTAAVMRWYHWRPGRGHRYHVTIISLLRRLSKQT